MDSAANIILYLERWYDAWKPSVSLQHGISLFRGSSSPYGGLFSGWSRKLVRYSAWEHTIVRPLEGDDLLRHFGDRHECYRKDVRCRVPRRRPYRAVE